jgi:hypothetical protein
MLGLHAAILSGPRQQQQQQNPIAYTLANTVGSKGTTFGFQPTSEHFTLLSPPITSRYAGVVWRVLEPVALPEDIVTRYNNSAMAITGFEVDVVRVDASGKETAVPNYQSYNHHYVSTIHGAGVRLPEGVVGTSNLRHHHHLYVRTGAAGAAISAADEVTPHVQAFNEHNGNEARQTYHGLPQGYVQPLFSPRAWVFNPMQINTLNPDGSGRRGGPLPRSSAARPGAPYSGILECPCTTRIFKDVNRSRICRTHEKAVECHGFYPSCTSDTRRSDLLAAHNPTCDVRTYVGGMECCKDRDVLLDADQPQPAHADEVRFKWRIYHEKFAPRLHTPLIHLEWAVNGCDSGGPHRNKRNCAHIEYDVTQAPPGTPASAAVHVVTSHFAVRDMLAPTCDAATDAYCASMAVAQQRGGGVKLIMAGGHCHSPACLSLELYNDDSGELLCRITPVHGTGDKVYDEEGYLYLPPCQWSEHDARLRPPPRLMLDTRLRAVKRANSSVYHYGVMGIWQMRGAYL